MADSKTRKQRLLQRCRQAGLKAALVWLTPEAQAAMAALRQPGETVDAFVNRALITLQGLTPTGTSPAPHPYTRLCDGAGAALVALLQALFPEGERRYLRDCGITMLPLAQLNAVLAPLGYVLVGTKTRAAERFVLCTDVHGEIERYGRFALRRIEKEMCDAYMDVGVRPHHGVWAPAECHARRGTVADAVVLWLRCRGSRGALCLTLWLPRGGPAGHHPTAPRVCATRAGVCPPTGRGTRLVVL